MNLRNILAIGVAATGFTLAAPAATIDASAPGLGGTVNGAYFVGLDPNATGTGRIEPFVRIQYNDKDPNDAGTEVGMNTDVNNYLYNKNGPWTHDLPIAWLGTISAPPASGLSGNFYEFFLDANQVGNGKVSLTQLKVFISPTALTSSGDLDALRASLPAWSLDTTLLNSQVLVTGNSGSGSGDLSVFIPQSVIGASGYLYLFSEFGGSVETGESKYLANDGFEEWRALYGPQAPPPPVPDAASTVALLGSALSGLALLRRRLL